tara:strand:- start:33636 stop:33917 length:282 start_codon:yes stop_codon:yes gene_type:complete
MSKEKEILKELKKDKEGKYILPLSTPITWGSAQITELNLEEPKAKHLRGLSGSPNMDEILGVIGKLAGQPDSLIDELSMKDTNKAAEFFAAFE